LSREKEEDREPALLLLLQAAAPPMHCISTIAKNSREQMNMGRWNWRSKNRKTKAKKHLEKILFIASKNCSIVCGKVRAGNENGAEEEEEEEEEGEREWDVRVRDETTAMVPCDGSEQRERRPRRGRVRLRHVEELLPHSH
jgi:hypothetical protein